MVCTYSNYVHAQNNTDTILNTFQILSLPPPPSAELMAILFKKEVLNTPYTGIKEFSFVDKIRIGCELNYNSMNENECPLQDVKLHVVATYESGVKKKAESYYENGIKSSETLFYGEGECDRYYAWFETGELEEYLLIKDGNEQLRIRFYRNGIIRHFSDTTGERGLIIGWNEKGQQKSFDIGVDRSIYNRHEKIYSNKGKLVYEYNYNNGKQPFKVYWPNGNLEILGTMVNAPIIFVGKWQEWHENGEKRVEGNFHPNNSNVPMGKWRYWDENGTLIKEERYKNGELIFEKKYVQSENDSIKLKQIEAH